MIKLNRIVYLACNVMVCLWMLTAAGWSLEGGLYCGCVPVLIQAAVVDERTFEIPPFYNRLIGIAGMVRLISDLPHFGEYVAGMCCVSGLFAVIWQLTGGKAVGGGDIKLMASAGLLLGWRKIMVALLAGAVAGTVIHTARMKLMGKTRVLALGPYLVIGIFTAMAYGNEIIDWYIKLHF